VTRFDVVDNLDEHRYEIRLGDDIAILNYARDPKSIELIHTEVPEHLRHDGVGGELVAFAIDDAIAKGLTVIPSCPFVEAWLREHPEVAKLAMSRR
jgi:predicted GNAT family acetyltransferase